MEAQAKDQAYYHFLFMLSAGKGLVSQEQNRDLLTIQEGAPKALFMTARPGRTRAFIPLSLFMHNWIKHNQIYLDTPPHVAMIHSDMKEDPSGMAQALHLTLANPERRGNNSWAFNFTCIDDHLDTGTYHDMILFIDWTPALICPEPIRIQVPSLISHA